MRRIITGIFIVMFALLSVFGLSFMTHQGSVSHDGCLVGGAFGTECPQDIGAFSMIDLHFSALDQFSSVLVLAPFFAAAPILLSVLLALTLCAGGRFSATRVAAVIRFRRSFDRAHFTFKRQLIEWLSLHSRRAPSLVGVFNF